MQRLCALTSWLNNNSGVVTTLATVVIAYASWISSRIIRLQKRIERANRMPVLTFVERVEAALAPTTARSSRLSPSWSRRSSALFLKERKTRREKTKPCASRVIWFAGRNTRRSEANGG